MPEHDWTETQGQHLAFITNYGVPPAEADMQPWVSHHLSLHPGRCTRIPYLSMENRTEKC
jgi:hypothetical protein